MNLHRDQSDEERPAHCQTPTAAKVEAHIPSVCSPADLFQYLLVVVGKTLRERPLSLLVLDNLAILINWHSFKIGVLCGLQSVWAFSLTN